MDFNKIYLENLYIENLDSECETGKLTFIWDRYPDNSYVVFINYLNSGANNNPRCIPGESLILEGDPFTTRKGIVFQPGEPVVQLVTGVCTFLGAAAVLSEGIYFARGYFVEVEKQTVVLSPFINDVNSKVGLLVNEDIINSDIDPSLADNAAGYNNYTAPGADRLRLELRLKALPLNSEKPPNFIELMEIRNGGVAGVISKPQYSGIGREFARRTFDESGNYYVKPYKINARNTLNDFEGNNGIFEPQQSTYNNNQPKEDLGTYKISPGKAYVNGFAVETIAPAFLDFKKPRTTKTLEDQSINYFTGPTFTLNNVIGAPQIGVGTDYTVSLRDQRVGIASTTAAGKEIGLARVYDFALESGSYDTSKPKTNEWDIALYDIQPYTDIALNAPHSLTVPTHVKGKSSGATGYLRNDVSSSTSVTVYNTKGKFITGEQFIFNGIESGFISAGSTSYNTSDIKSIHGTVGTANTFNADVKQSLLANIGEVNITPAPTSGASWSPSKISYTGNNRTHMIRIPDPGRFELRLMDGSANPYLLQAGMLALGLDGINNKIDPGEPLFCNMYTDYKNYQNLKKLPNEIEDAIEELDQSKELRESFGEDVIDSYVKLKNQEIDNFNKEERFDKKSSITDWEKNNTLDC